MENIPMIPISKDQKIKLLHCIKAGVFNPEIFPELYNYICPKPLSKQEAKAHLNEFLAENMDEYIKEHMTRSQALEHADRLKRADGWNGM